MKFFEVEIGTAEDPEAVITVRVTADTGQTMGLTCVRACGADMAGDLMAWTGSDESVRRRHTAWPSPPDRYRIEIRDPSAGAGETIVTAMAEDGSTASGSCQARHVYRMAVTLLRELRREADQERAWDLDREVPPDLGIPLQERRWLIGWEAAGRTMNRCRWIPTNVSLSSRGWRSDLESPSMYRCFLSSPASGK